MGLLEEVRQAKVYDLSQPYYVGMPHHPSHPPFVFGLTKKHGDFQDRSGMSSAADSLAMSGHTGTHIDALCHFSYCGKLHNGDQVAEHQSYGQGIDSLSAETIAPILRRGVLLDIAGAEPLAKDFVIEPKHLESALGDQTIESGDVVLLRTGWARAWGTAKDYISEVHGPGPAIAGARWLSSRNIFAAGSDTVAFEHVPDPATPVHVHMLVECGIHLIENLNLEQLAADRVHSFVFVAAPLRIRGGTGAPMRPLALV